MRRIETITVKRTENGRKIVEEVRYRRITYKAPRRKLAQVAKLCAN